MAIPPTPRGYFPDVDLILTTDWVHGKTPRYFLQIETHIELTKDLWDTINKSLDPDKTYAVAFGHFYTAHKNLLDGNPAALAVAKAAFGMP